MQVLVVGAGLIGVGVAILAALDGGNVSIADRGRDRLDLVGRVTGISQLMQADEQLARSVAAATGGQGRQRF
jgi:threonine dehydrogenase-like Zn-dependent dehydrogenase